MDSITPMLPQAAHFASQIDEYLLRFFGTRNIMAPLSTCAAVYPNNTLGFVWTLTWC